MGLTSGGYLRTNQLVTQCMFHNLSRTDFVAYEWDCGKKGKILKYLYIKGCNLILGPSVTEFLRYCPEMSSVTSCQFP